MFFMKIVLSSFSCRLSSWWSLIDLESAGDECRISWKTPHIPPVSRGWHICQMIQIYDILNTSHLMFKGFRFASCHWLNKVFAKLSLQLPLADYLQCSLFGCSSRIRDTYSHLHCMMFQTIQTIYFLWGYDPGNMSVSFIAELSPVYCCLVYVKTFTKSAKLSVFEVPKWRLHLDI